MRTRLICVTLLLLCWPVALAAQVEVQFYSKDFGSSFPHAFVRLVGTVDGSGEAIDTNYGFTAARIGVSLLTGPVPGKIQTVDSDYVARSDRHFALKLTDDQYRAVLRTVEKWRTMPQPSYRLNSRNCVFFVAEIAETLGLSAPPDNRLMKKPKSFLDKVRRDNQALIAGWNSLPGKAPSPLQAAHGPTGNPVPRH